MSCTYRSVIAPSGGVTDLCGATRLTTLRVIDCTDSNDNPTCESLWASRLCDADLPYSQPVSNDQTISLQFRFRDNRNNWGNIDPTTTNYQIEQLPSIIVPSPTYGWRADALDMNYLVDIELLDCCCNPIEFDLYPLFTGWVGKYNNQYYQTIQFNVADIPFDCFSFRARTWDNRYAYTECYRVVKCEDTVCLGALDTAVTCFGSLLEMPVKLANPNSRFAALHNDINFYLGTNSPHDLSVCFEGKALEQQYNIDKEAKNAFVSNMELYKLSRVVSTLVPDYVAKQTAEVLSANRISYAGESWQYSGQLSGKNENNNMWALDFTLQQFICSKKYGCS